MIKTFSTDRNTLFFPTRWANAVARWILGLMSKEGTIKITNTPNPSDDGGCSIDVNMDAVYDEIKRRLDEDAKRKNDDDETIEQIIEEENAGSGSGKYGVRVAFEYDAQLGQNFPTGFKWIAFGTEANLDTYTGEVASLLTGSDVGHFSCNDGVENPPVKVIEGYFLKPRYAAKPTFDSDTYQINGIYFGSEASLVSGSSSQYLDLSNLGGGSGKYGVKPTFTNGVLSKLEFGTEDELDGDSPESSVDTVVGCPYQ